jgi:hypothetical protein
MEVVGKAETKRVPEDRIDYPEFSKQGGILEQASITG